MPILRFHTKHLNQNLWRRTYAHLLLLLFLSLPGKAVPVFPALKRFPGKETSRAKTRMAPGSSSWSHFQGILMCIWAENHSYCFCWSRRWISPHGRYYSCSMVFPIPYCDGKANEQRRFESWLCLLLRKLKQ